MHTFFLHFVLLVILSYDANTAETVTEIESHCKKALVASQNRTDLFVNVGAQEATWASQPSPFSRSALRGQDPSAARDGDADNATMEMCYMSKNGQGKRSALSRMWLSLDGMCGPEPWRSKWKLVLGRTRSLDLFEKEKKNEEPVCSPTHSSGKSPPEEGERKRYREDEGWWKQRSCQRGRKHWLLSALTLCQLPGCPFDQPLDSGRWHWHRNVTATESGQYDILDIVQRQYSQQRVDFSANPGISGQRADATGCAGLVGQSKSPISKIPYKGFTHRNKQSWQGQEDAPRNCGSQKSPQICLGKASRGLHRIMEQTVAGVHPAAGHSCREGEQSHQRHPSGQQGYSELEPAGCREQRQPGAHSPCRTFGGQCGHVYLQGQRDLGETKEVAKSLAGLRGFNWRETPQGSSGDRGFRRRKGSQEEATPFSRATKLGTLVIIGRYSTCHYLSEEHCGPRKLRFDPLVEAYGPPFGEGCAASQSFTIATTFHTDDFLQLRRPHGDLDLYNLEIDAFDAALRAQRTASCLRFQVVCDFTMPPSTVFRLLEQPQAAALTTDEAIPLALPQTVAEGDPLVIIDEWSDLLQLLTNPSEAGDDEIAITMYGLLMRHHSTRRARTGATIEDIRLTIQQSWSDVIPPGGVIFVHLVKPQSDHPSEASSLDVVVEIIPFGVDIPPNDIPTLRSVYWHEDATIVTEAVYLLDQSNGFEILRDSELQDWCHHGVQCNLHIEGRLALMPRRHELHRGSKIDIYIHPFEDSDNTDDVTLMQTPRPSQAPGLIPLRLLGRHHVTAQIHVNQEEPLMSQLRSNWPLATQSASELEAAHYVAFPPQYVSAPPESLYLLQFREDRFSQIHTDDVMILLTISFTSPSNANTQKVRVLWGPRRTTRDQFLGFVRVRWFCDQATTLCHTFLNNHIWQDRDSVVRRLSHGDHVRVQIRSDKIQWSDLEFSEEVECEMRIFADSPENVAPQASESLSEYTVRSRSRERSRDRNQPNNTEDEGPEEEEDGGEYESDSHSLIQTGFRARVRAHGSLSSAVDPHVRDRWCVKQSEANPWDIPVHCPDVFHDEGDPSARHSFVNGPSQHIPSKHPDPERADINIDFAKVIRHFEWLDNHFALPCFDLPSNFPVTPQSLEWVQLPWWNYETHAEEIHIYVDGSTESEGSGAGIAAFVCSEGTWYFAGMFSSSLEVSNSYQAELAAATFGLKVGHDICKLAALRQGYAPQIVIRFDALTVGNQLLGNWACHQAPMETRVLRCLATLIETRFNVSVQGYHVKGHCGEPGNELVDTLANQASKGNALTDFKPFLEFTCESNFADSADWFWMLFRGDLVWQEQTVTFPAKPTTEPEDTCLPISQPATSGSDKFKVAFRCASINVLTLKGTAPGDIDLEGGIGGPTRSHIVMQQLSDAGITFFALQETRTTTSRCRHTPDFWLFGGPATTRGHFGIVVGFSKKLPIATGTGGPIYFAESDFAIIAAAPRFLIVRVRSCAFKTILIAAHAPHTGADLGDISRFWQDLSKQIPPRYSDWPRILLADANARVGTITSSHIGSFQAEADSEKSEPFRNFLAEEALWLPATFEEHQVGEGATWKGLTRNDFVAISQQWDFHHCRTWVDLSVDVSLTSEDHSAAMLELGITTTQRVHRRGQPQQRRFDEESVLETCTGIGSSFNEFLTMMTPKDWCLDVHSHARQIEDAIVSKVDDCTTRQTKPLRKIMSDGTWELVQQKRTLRRQLFSYRDLQKKHVLLACFWSWKIHDGGWDDLGFARIQKNLDQNIAISLWEFRRLGRLVTSAIRQDDRNFFQQLAQEGADVFEQGTSKQFWNVIRRSLPKFRQRRLGLAPMKIEGLEQQWEDYFQDLEVGQATSASALIKNCVRSQNESSVEETISLADLPTLYEIEREFRATTAYRSTGFDPIPSGLFRTCAKGMAQAHYDIILKQFLWQTEPIQGKGGPLVVIPKRLQANEVHHFRGIMLLPTMAKRVHAILRKRIMGLLEPLRPEGQLGGFARQQVGFGSQPLRIFGRLMDSKGLTSGVLFVDLANAFHRLVRELVTGLVLPEDAAEVVANLQHHGHSTDGICRWMELPGLLTRLRAPPLLVKMMQDIHCHTWYQLEVSDGPTVTRRGTRPGSPLADCVFHVLMMDIIIELNDWIRAQEPYMEILQEVNIQLDTIVWSDDLAIPWCTRQAQEFLPAMKRLLRKVHTCFARRGFQLNLAKQKTSAVISFRGPGAKPLREMFYLRPHGGEPCTFDDASEGVLHVVPMYKHLGTFFTEKHDLEAEIGVRIGTAWSAFQSISKTILANRRLPLRVRSHMFKALILTKLFFGSGTWHTPTLAQCRKLRSVLWRMCQRILGNQDRNNNLFREEVFVKLRILDPRIYIAQERLRFAQAIFSNGPPFARHLLQQELLLAPDSWLSGVSADLDWMRNVGAFPEHPGIADLEAAIQFWKSTELGSQAKWKSMLATTVRRHLQQEATIQETHALQRGILRALTNNGAQFSPDPRENATRDATFECFCGKLFTTGQGLASHKRIKHGIRSLESDLLDGATCPCCLTFCWTTQRLQQHLAYISRRTSTNACYNWLRERGYKAGEDVETFMYPSMQRGVRRLDALPAMGPPLHLTTVEENRRIALQTELMDKLLQLEMPEVPQELRCRRFDDFDRCLLQWFADFVEAGFSVVAVSPLGNRLLECFGDEEQEVQWSEQVLIDWVAERCQQHMDAFEDGEAELIVESEIALLLVDLPRHALLTRVRTLQQTISAIEQGTVRTEYKGHRPIRTGGANARERQRTLHSITVAYEDQPRWQAALEAAQWQTLPKRHCLPVIKTLCPRPHFLVAHLFSGRRRMGDVHYHLDKWAASYNVTITILSLDTAVSGHYGNLCIDSCSWRRILELFESGWVSGGIAGSPCETFSAARNQRPVEVGPNGHLPKWPRPLRTARRPFGLSGLTGKEYRQLKQGSAFFLQSTLLAVWQLINGGIFLSEHPGPPPQQQYASIWRTGILKLLMGHPEVKLHVVQQWR